jgi:hypothetical protein
MSDDAASIHDPIEPDAPPPSSPTTTDGTTEKQLVSELDQQEAGLRQSDPELYAQIHAEEESAVSAGQKDPAERSELDQQYLQEAAQQVAAVDPALGLQMEAEVAALDSLTARPDPAQAAPTPTTPAPVLAAEAQFAAQNPAVVAQIEQVEANETQAIADAPGMAAQIEGQATQEILGDVSKVDPALAKALESELDATEQRLGQEALSAEELRIQERLTEPAPERPGPAT